MRHRVYTDPSPKQEYSAHVSRLSAEPHRKFILTLTHTLLTLRTLMWLFIPVGKSNLDFHCSSWPRVYWTRLGKSWCADRAGWTGSVIWPWICHASLASYFAAFTLWHHHVAVTPITQPVSEIHVLSWTDLECQKRDIKDKSKKGPSWGQKWPMWSMWFSPRMARQLTERCLEVRISALPYARLAGLLSHTEVNDAHLVAAHSYLTAPVTLPPPLRTCCVRVRDCTRARVCRTWLYARSHVLHSSVTLPPREDMCRSLSQVHCQQLWAGVCRFFFKFTVRSFSLCWLRWICCIFAKIFPPLSANISPHATCQHFLLPFRAGDFGIIPYIWRSVPCLNKSLRICFNLIGKRLTVFQETTPYCLTHLSKGIANGKWQNFSLQALLKVFDLRPAMSSRRERCQVLRNCLAVSYLSTWSTIVHLSPARVCICQCAQLCIC